MLADVRCERKSRGRTNQLSKYRACTHGRRGAVEPLRERPHHTTHAVANMLIEIGPLDPDKARSETYGLSYLRRNDEAGTEWPDFFSGRYIDKFERRNGEWGIAHRVVVHAWPISNPLAATAFPLPVDSFIQEKRDETDLVYQ